MTRKQAPGLTPHSDVEVGDMAEEYRGNRAGPSLQERLKRIWARMNQRQVCLSAPGWLLEVSEFLVGFA